MDYSTTDYQYGYTDYPAPNPMLDMYTSPFFWVFVIIVLAGMWKVFTKAGQDGWKAIIPFYNFYVLLNIVGKPGWWLILYFIPFVNLVVAIIVGIRLAEVFGRSAWFGFFLNFLIPVGPLILGFGSAKYKGKGKKK